MNTDIKNINNIINHISSIKEGTYKKTGVCVLIGAGADISSGGILFRDLKLLFLKENGCIVPNNITDKMLDNTFEEQIEKLSQDGRCETLEKIMKKNKKPSEGYLLLVMLAEMGYINAVITTNFDYLLEETQELLNLNPFTIYTPGRSIPEDYYLRRTKIPPIYLKMHGDIFDRLVTHLTQSEIRNKKYGNKFIELFNHIIQNNSIIIVGYGGYDNLITEIFNQEMNNIDEVYWCNICEPKNDSDLANALKQKNKLWYVNTSFDNLFQGLAKKLLKDAKLKNANPIFLPTVVQCKIEYQKLRFVEKIKFGDKLINRSKAQEALDSFLQSFNDKCFAVIGEYKFGKSCFVYKAMQSIQDITFLPIICNHDYSILANMAQVLGYDTDVPFSIMYSFLKWWNEKREHLVFILDDFFNPDYFQKVTNTNYIIEFFNFIYIAREFKYIQFVITFQSCVYEEIEKSNTFEKFKNIISKYTEIGKFSDDEVENLLNHNGNSSNIHVLKKQELLHIPYVWEIIHKENITLTENTDYFTQFTDAIYNISTRKYDFTKHAFNTLLRNLAHNQLFSTVKPIDTTSGEYMFLEEENIINANSKIIYPELSIYFCKKYILHADSWENVIFERIIPDILKNSNLSDMQIEVYISIWAEVEDIDQYNTILKSLENIINIKTISIFQRKIILQVLQRCFKSNKNLFLNYLKNIDINNYSLELQNYLFKVCVELYPEIMTIWENCDGNIAYTAFIISDDVLYNTLKLYTNEITLETEIIKNFSLQNGLIKLWHILTYWGWDNLSIIEYTQLKNIISNKIIPVIKTDDDSVQYTIDVLKKYAYNIFFNAGEDFEEQFIHCRTMPIYELIKKVLDEKAITEKEYISLIQMNIDINNSWLFIISNIIVVQSMHNYPDETYNMLYYFWDNTQLDIQVQYIDFFLSSVFWALYLNEPFNREKFINIFEKIVEKYERILFMFPETKRKASLNKFSEEFDTIFEDGFNPTAFYFYTAPYKSLTTPTFEWGNGKEDLKVYWNLVEYMSDLGKFDDILRIVHALGQMISIYPEEGYLALENLTGLDHPIIKRGIVRIFKENYLRYSSITKEELKKSIYHFDNDDVEEIIYNTDSLLANRTLEQLHWGRFFYNWEQLMDVNVSEVFLSNILHSHSCSGFLRDFINGLLK